MNKNNISRRDFLKVTGKGALGLAIVSQFGCDNFDGVPESAWRDFANSLQGVLLRPGDPAYPQSNRPWNLDYSGIRAQAIVLTASADDIKKSILFAREHNLPAAARSGSHSYAAYSSTPGLMIDVSNMNSINIDTNDGLVDIGAGAPLGSVDNATAPFDILVPAGRCESVGIAGLLLGGGFGFNGRKFGLTSDNLVQTQIVTADGELLNCNKSENSDLFWACRGGGGGNFGINVAFQVQGYEVTTASVYQLCWNGDADLEAVWDAMQNIAFNASDDFSLRLGIEISEDGPKPGSTNVSIEALGQLFQGSASDLRELLEPAFQASTPDSFVIEELSFADATKFLEEGASPDAFLSKSAYIDGPLPQEGVSKMVSRFTDQSWPAASREGTFKFFSWGGQYNRTASEATAFVHRSAAFVIESDASWHVGDPQSVIDASRSWIQELFQDLRFYFNGSAYQNFIDPTLEDWELAYYGSNFPGLVDIKRKYDPDNFFKFAQGIPTKL
jgi:hypothetical protein